MKNIYCKHMHIKRLEEPHETNATVSSASPGRSKPALGTGVDHFSHPRLLRDRLSQWRSRERTNAPAATNPPPGKPDAFPDGPAINHHYAWHEPNYHGDDHHGNDDDRYYCYRD